LLLRFKPEGLRIHSNPKDYFSSDNWEPTFRRITAGKHKMTNMVISIIIEAMRTVNISDLKAQLSAHIQFVKNGEEVLVCDRNKPVARIVPCHLEDRSEQEQRLVAKGVLTPPLKKRPTTGSWPKPPGNVPDEVMARVWREERESQ
jgi:antitoxin (DNA-binding transcriptional repressor) of toxin-antitoxin stability system/predicted nucleic acid-binding protein